MNRKTAFDREEILSIALKIFWENGYEQTSLKDLTTATGLHKGSLYNSFESKENLFLLCLEKYELRSKSFFYIEGDDPYQYLKKFFSRLIREAQSKDNYKGCLVMNSCLEFSGKKGRIASKANLLFRATELNLARATRAISGISKLNQDKLQSNLVAAAFSIREISKFKKDKLFFKQIANNALRDLNIII